MSVVATAGPPSIDRRRTILFLTSRLGMGGAERHTITLANLLSDRFRIVFAYLKPDEDMIDALDRQSLLELRCLHVRKRFDMRAARELAEMARTHGADLIVCANAFALLYAHLARAVSRQPLSTIEVFHTTILRTLKEQLEMVFYRPVFWVSHHVVFVCKAQRRYWLKRGLWGRQVHMVYNGVDTNHFAPLDDEASSHMRAALGFGPDDRIVGICAVLRPEKAHDALLSAVAQLRDRGQRWKIVLIGDGPLRPAIEAHAAALGVADCMHITGFKADVRPYLALCDAIALVSTSETFSIAALEAMAMAKPMIMSDVGGAREQVQHGQNGLLFPPGDISALAACIEQCWDRGMVRRMGAAARHRVEQEFSQGRMIDRYAELFSASPVRQSKCPSS